MLDDDVGTELDLSMIVRRENIPGRWTPDGVLTRFESTTLGRLVKEIDARPDSATIDFGFMILTFSEKAVIGISRLIDELVRRARMDGKNHDTSVPIRGGKTGLTVHCNFDSVEVASQRLGTHCAMRKYTQKVDSWFGICIDPNDIRLKLGVNLNFKWERDKEMDKLTKDMQKPSEFNDLTLKQITKIRKVGRNEPCPCGSGKKSKKCCHS